jgi:hypothetical protein
MAFLFRFLAAADEAEHGNENADRQSDPTEFPRRGNPHDASHANDLSL